MGFSEEGTIPQESRVSLELRPTPTNGSAEALLGKTARGGHLGDALVLSLLITRPYRLSALGLSKGLRFTLATGLISHRSLSPI